MAIFAPYFRHQVLPVNSITSKTEKCSFIQQLRHDYQIFQMAIFDWVLVILATFLLHHFLLPKLSPIRIFVILILLGLLTHFVLKINTMLGYYLLLNPDPRPGRPVCS